jgi:radical SAM protein with 4Fe4S-binding SPASM domain
MARQRLREEHPLRYVFLELTRRCNLRCAYCGSDCTDVSARQELDTDTWLRVIREIAEDFDAKMIMVAVTGGEPLLRKDLFILLAELRTLGFPFGMVTNGTLLTPKVAEQLVSSGMGSISISMDSIPPINDELRGKGAGSKVVSAIESLRSAGYKGVLEIISTITAPCMPHLDEMRRIVSGLKVAQWRMAPVMPVGRAESRPDLLLDAAQTRALLEYIQDCRFDDLKPVPEFSEEGFLGDEFEGLVRPYLCRCDAGITVASVLHDGRIGACPELADEFVQGHVAHDRFKDVWEERYHPLRDRSWTKKGICADCEAFDHCLGGALHLYKSTRHQTSRCLFRMMTESAPD